MIAGIKDRLCIQVDENNISFKKIESGYQL